MEAKCIEHPEISQTPLSILSVGSILLNYFCVDLYMQDHYKLLIKSTIQLIIKRNGIKIGEACPSSKVCLCP